MRSENVSQWLRYREMQGTLQRELRDLRREEDTVATKVRNHLSGCAEADRMELFYRRRMECEQAETLAYRHYHLALALGGLMGDPSHGEEYVNPNRIDGGTPDQLERWAAVSCSGEDFRDYAWTSTSMYRDEAEGMLHTCIVDDSYPGRPLLLVDLDNGISYEPIIQVTFRELSAEPTP